MKDLSIAILIDGGFFLKRYFKLYKNSRNHTPAEVAKNLYTLAHRHVGDDNYLYRIFYYDSVPFDKRLHNPISGKVIDFAKSEQAIFRNEFFEELKKKRKIALRLGYLRESKNWLIRPRLTKELFKKNIAVDELTEDDVIYELRQKGIDIKIGVDIASMAIKRLVERIVLFSGDSDFVPAAKLARREGIDFILDPMWNPIDANLFEHIDGLKSTCPKPIKISK
jgi:uncharacterized LabA/DUF88 family protein